AHGRLAASRSRARSGSVPESRSIPWPHYTGKPGAREAKWANDRWLIIDGPSAIGHRSSVIGHRSSAIPGRPDRRPGRPQNESALMTSPLLIVFMLIQIAGLIVFLMNRTEPSPRVTLMPPA